VRLGRIGFPLACACLVACVLALSARRLDEPGLYYDEVIQATPASEFLRAGGEPLGIPGARSTWLFGGWLPLMTQPYMGALKSQLLIPTFAVFGASPASLRLATLLWGCAGLLLCAGWMRSVYGSRVALLAAALVAVDPSFVFVTRHDWGSVSLALVCRGGGLWLLTAGWCARSRGRLAAGALLLGLGVYNKIDFAPFLAGAGLALLACVPRGSWREISGRARDVVAAAAGLAAGALPMLWSATAVFAATRAIWSGAEARGSDLAEKLTTWQHMLDGSHFHRLMLAGGSFERVGEVAGAAAGPFAWLFAASFAWLAVTLLRDARAGRPFRAELFALATTLGTALALLLVPRAARIHHVMNVYPFPQLVLALACVRLWDTAAGRGAPGAAPALRRTLAAGAALLALAGSLRIDLAVQETLRETGGLGRWSGALGALARELPPDAHVVSLDWGFHAPLRLLRPELDLAEPVWALARGRDGPGLALVGGPDHVYLVQAPQYRVFDVGASLLDALAELPLGTASVREHRDGSGETAFRSIRFARPHRLVYRGAFEVSLE
jgi:hypothetical protein